MKDAIYFMKKEITLEYLLKVTSRVKFQTVSRLLKTANHKKE